MRWEREWLWVLRGLWSKRNVQLFDYTTEMFLHGRGVGHGWSSITLEGPLTNGSGSDHTVNLNTHSDVALITSPVPTAHSTWQSISSRIIEHRRLIFHQLAPKPCLHPQLA